MKLIAKPFSVFFVAMEFVITMNQRDSLLSILGPLFKRMVEFTAIMDRLCRIIAIFRMRVDLRRTGLTRRFKQEEYHGEISTEKASVVRLKPF
jgi:hypothetical protein